MGTQSGKPPLATARVRAPRSPPSSKRRGARRRPRRRSAAGMIFALDATMSRQPTWDLAQSLQGRMFQAAAGLGGLDVQLVYFRGMGECRASRFVSGGQGLAELMSRISVRGGTTQLRKVLAHARDEARRAKVGALVFVGDAMEEGIDPLMADRRRARALRRQGVHVPGGRRSRRRGAPSRKSPASPAAPTAPSTRARPRGSRRCCAPPPPTRRADAPRLEAQAIGDGCARALLEQMRGA